MAEQLNDAQKQVVKDEADAEQRYLAGLWEAQNALERIRLDERREDAERTAAARAKAALARIEVARQAARIEADEAAAHKTFGQKVREFFAGPGD